MDFGKNILVKYGWKEGEGLGKDSNGITKPLRPSLKFDKQGLGADGAEEFNNNWWERAFNEASKNINVEKTNNNVSFNVSGSTEITTKSYSVDKFKKSMKGKKYKNFLKSSLLTQNAEVTKKEDEDIESFKLDKCPTLTDDDLIAACGGRTAHKGARHGLNLSGKLARIQEQDEKLLAHFKNKTEATNKESKISEIFNSNNETESSLTEDKVDSTLNCGDYVIKSRNQSRKEKRIYNKLSRSINSLEINSQDEIESESEGKKRKIENEGEKSDSDRIEHLLNTTDYGKKSKTKRRKEQRIYNELSTGIDALDLMRESTEKSVSKSDPSEDQVPKKRKNKKRKKGKRRDMEILENNKYKELVNDQSGSDPESPSTHTDPVHKIKSKSRLAKNVTKKTRLRKQIWTMSKSLNRFNASLSS